MGRLRIASPSRGLFPKWSVVKPRTPGPCQRPSPRAPPGVGCSSRPRSLSDTASCSLLTSRGSCLLRCPPSGATG
uniref:Uncharacterized protein n=1 Tax=uncultured marine virus TaxID=186617 RepID=A0A0F7LAL4_9VIRU|nr:hypothetical protein [uncultured marine virus]